LSVASRNLSNIFEAGSEAAPQRPAKVSVKSQLSSVDSTEDAKSVVTKPVVAKIAEVMSMSADNVSPERSVADLGVDSLVAVEFRSWMSKELDVTLVCDAAVHVCVLNSFVLIHHSNRSLRSLEARQSANSSTRSVPSHRLYSSSSWTVIQLVWNKGQECAANGRTLWFDNFMHAKSLVLVVPRLE
jgi:acyl carrier protein